MLEEDNKYVFSSIILRHLFIYYIFYKLQNKNSRQTYIEQEARTE